MKEQKKKSYFELYYEMFINEKTKTLSADAIILYSMMANQVGLSERSENKKKIHRQKWKSIYSFYRNSSKRKIRY